MPAADSAKIFERTSNLSPFEMKNFEVETLLINSRVLKGNPLKDETRRHNVVLVPKARTKETPVVLVLAGFTGNGPNYFSPKTFEFNMPQVIDQCCTAGKAPKAIYAFIDAMTFWGGSQFINSKGTGRYEDYIVKEVRTALLETYDVSAEPYHWCVMGGSSGGYGSLHLVSQYPEHFGLAAAIAPDSFFEMSLLPDIYTALPVIERIGGINAVAREMQRGFAQKREAHSVLNAIAMGLCYSPSLKGRDKVDFPVDLYSGELIPEVWERWKKHDPLNFLEDRKKNLKSIERIFLEVGLRDQYHLQFGARQLKGILQKLKVNIDYGEFDGNHFDISARRPYVWQWLQKLWK